MEEWYTFNQDKLKIVSLITAGLVLGFAIYRWLLMKWRNDVNLRSYAHFMALDSSMLKSQEMLKIEVPQAQNLKLTLEYNGQIIETLYDEEAPSGILELSLDMQSRSAGEYTLVMQSDDQHFMKIVHWSGLD